MMPLLKVFPFHVFDSIELPFFDVPLECPSNHHSATELYAHIHKNVLIRNYNMNIAIFIAVSQQQKLLIEKRIYSSQNEANQVPEVFFLKSVNMKMVSRIL